MIKRKVRPELEPGLGYFSDKTCALQVNIGEKIIVHVSSRHKEKPEWEEMILATLSCVFLVTWLFAQQVRDVRISTHN